MKSTEVDESLSTASADVLFQRIPTSFKIKSTEWEIYTKIVNFSLRINMDLMNGILTINPIKCWYSNPQMKKNSIRQD